MTLNDNIYGPLDGTPRPPGPPPAAPAPAQAPVAPAAGQLPLPEGVAPGSDGSAARSGARRWSGARRTQRVRREPTGKPPVAVAYYDPQNGRYLTPDGRYQQQTSVAAGGAAKTWKDLLPT